MTKKNAVSQELLRFTAFSLSQQVESVFEELFYFFTFTAIEINESSPQLYVTV